jgi:NAD(P)-dependent dehydrogenase (short-subunit alcohol dehydrogenase family)
LAGLGVKTWLVRADFEKESEYGTLIRRANRLAGGLDILVNSASIFPPGPLERVSFDDLVQAVRVNAWVPFVLSRDFSRIAQRGRPAKIVNLLDSRITAMDFDHLAYLLSKQMLATLTRMTALRFAPHVTVNSVAPGAILPPPGKPRRYLAKRAQAVPLKRPGGPEDIAQAVLFLLKSDYISGNVLFVDGGMNLTEAHAWIGS